MYESLKNFCNFATVLLSKLYPPFYHLCIWMWLVVLHSRIYINSIKRLSCCIKRITEIHSIQCISLNCYAKDTKNRFKSRAKSLLNPFKNGAKTMAKKWYRSVEAMVGASYGRCKLQSVQATVGASYVHPRADKIHDANQKQLLKQKLR